ncbi:hypothetical protein [Teredinibacter waterburyi]|uniref:hypothetical protein n=1 Tax=Teredinibacter waterburyi TaxID=1500538 RepID=UPI00165F1EDE|nr:hypothetical protein [Teredinibacter waterburyi]
MSVKESFKNWALGFSGVDGGDIGSPDKKSRWVCGIEWGAGHTPDELEACLNDSPDEIPKGYDSWEENIAYIFNWQVMKLFSAIGGDSVDNYKKFAKNVKPFVCGEQGYFKMNLYPIAFKDTDQEKWIKEFSDITGFNNKQEYISWCKQNRLNKIRKWASIYSPELVICLGKTYADDFLAAYCDSESKLNFETIDDREISWCINSSGTLVVILPFMVNQNGLVKNDSIQKVGERISELLYS